MEVGIRYPIGEISAYNTKISAIIEVIQPTQHALQRVKILLVIPNSTTLEKAFLLIRLYLDVPFPKLARERSINSSLIP